MTSFVVILLAVLVLANASLVSSQIVPVPGDFLERLRNWQIAFQNSPDVPHFANSLPDPKYGIVPPTGPIQVPLPPSYPNQPGYYPGQPPRPPTVNPPTPPPVLPPRPTYPTLPPPTKQPPAENPLSKYCLKPRGQFPSKTCNTYVNCWDDVVVEQECPSGLSFSEKGYCDYDYNVDCAKRPPNTTEQPATMPPSHGGHTGKCPSLYGYFRDAKNCSIFYVCVAGEPIKFDCPPTLVFNTVHGVCDYPYNVPSCPNAYYPPETPAHTTVSPYPPNYPHHHYQTPPPNYYPSYHPGIYQPYKNSATDFTNAQGACVEGTLIRLDPNCSQVSLCRNGKTEVINCGYEHAYDRAQDACVAKHLSTC